jgi:hypothetical protein
VWDRDKVAQFMEAQNRNRGTNTYRQRRCCVTPFAKGFAKMARSSPTEIFRTQIGLQRGRENLMNKTPERDGEGDQALIYKSD